MKKFLIAFLATLASVLMIAAIGCQNNCNGGNDDAVEYTVEFTPTENLEYICDGLEEGKTTLTVKSGSVVEFSVKVPVLYAVPTVYANNNPVGEKGGIYSVSVTSDVVITTEEVKVDSPSVPGSGTSDSPAMISSATDYLYIADRINAGDASYIGLFYELENDIDFGGMEIPVIGDGVNTYFMGNFNGGGHTISNFKINTNGLSYVGLFGYVMSSGNNDGTGMIVNLNIDNFEIEAQAAPNGAMFVGSFVGYAIASTVVACSATNGAIYVHADDTAFSYVGGAIGIQNSATITQGSTINYYPSSVSYIYTSVDISCDGGVLAAGGIAGYVYSEQERAIASVVDCYSEGYVGGGIYSGGIAGYLGDYSSMANCYSLGGVYSHSRYQNDQIIYSSTYAGGLVGYLGVDAIITDSFAQNEYVDGATEVAGANVYTGEIVGGKAEATAVAGEGVVFNCYFGNNVKTTSNFFKNTLYWQDCDWVITDGSYPVINQEEAQPNKFKVTFDYSGREVDKKLSNALSINLSEEFYAPMFYFYGEEFGDTVVADSGETSYGYFFDEGLTQKVPHGFIPTRNITLYTGFADYSAVAGTYYLVSHKSNREIKLTLTTDGVYTYNDGVEFTDFYTYDGKKLIFSNALFGRLSGSVSLGYDSSGNEVARPDFNYGFAKFAAVKTEGGLKIYDGTFFTEEASLIANLNVISGEYHYNGDEYIFYTDFTGTRNGTAFTYTLSGSVLTINISGNSTQLNVSELSKYDVFKGVWEIASNIYRRYEFDGKGNWTYSVKGVEKDSGTYSISDGVATLKSGLTAKIDASGLLNIQNGDDSEYFAKKDSFSGVWVDFDNNIIIYIEGFGSSLTGGALINIGGATTELIYILDGFFDVGDTKTVTLLNGYALYGYLTVREDGSFAATFFSLSTGEYLTGYNFYLLDTLEGDWVGEGTLDGVEFDSLNFNGLGIYENGSVVLNGEEVMEYILDNYFDATFGDYKVEFDDVNNTITISKNNESVTLYRKDEISEYVLISNDKIKYSFNGGGDLENGGKLTVTDASGKETVLGYKIADGSIEGLNLGIDLYSEFRGGTKVGTITINNYKFDVNYTQTISGLSNKTLTIDNPFTGTWSVSGFDTHITIGTLDLSNRVAGDFLDMGVTTYAYYPEYGCLMVPYQTGVMTSATQLYLIMLNEGNMVISSYEVLTAGDSLIYCAPSDELYGTWYDSTQNSTKALRFDGMADSLYYPGIAWDESGNLYNYTRRFGVLYFWSYDGERAYTIEVGGDEENASMVYEQNIYNYIVFNDFDLSSCILEVQAGDTVYKFYLTHVEVDGVEKEYTITSVKGDITELVINENEEDTAGVSIKVNHKERTIITAD